MNRAHAAAGLALVVVAVAAGIWWEAGEIRAPPMPAGMTAATNGDSAGEPTITVHVAGLVSRPGLVEVPAGARVADAIAAAGGLLPGAHTQSVNLAAPVADGQQIVVPGLTAGTSALVSAGPGGKMDLNLATAAELDALPGVGPVIAERIVAYREENGPFRAVEDLLDVPGIGEAKLAELRDRVRVP